MPRNRKRTESAQEVEQTQTNVVKERNNMELTLEQVTALLGETRSRGEYAEYLKDFIERGVIGEEIDWDNPLMVGKTPDQAKIGFENAKKQTVKDSNPPVLKIAGAGDVAVVKRNAGTKEAPELHLFLINKAVVQSNQSEAA